MRKNQVKLDNSFKLDIKSKIPYYYQLKQYIVKEIKSGNWHPGEMLPYENQLCKHFSISRTVVRQALQELQNEGFIITKKGKGTYIAEPEVSEDIIQNLIGFYETWTSMGFMVENVVLDLKIEKPEQKIKDNLELKENEEVIYLKRLSKLNDRPYSISLNYLPYLPLKGLLNEDFRFIGLYTLLEKKYNVELTHGQSTIEIAFATNK